MAPALIHTPPTPPSLEETVEPQFKHSKRRQDGFGTLAVHAGSPIDQQTGAVIPAITLSSTFAQSSVGKPMGSYVYSRKGNPNRDNLETAVAALEHAQFGLAFSSGSAAIATVLESLPAGSHVITIADVYAGTHRYFTQIAHKQGITISFVEDIESDLHEHVKPETALVWIESPSNPLLKLVDVEAISSQAHAKGLIVVVDNTLPNPYVFNPLDHGADIVLHSGTKWIAGHSDVVIGLLATNSPDLHDRLSFLQNAIGAIPSPFDCWLAHRGLKTLHLRAERACKSGLAIANALESLPDTSVVSVTYPGLASHPQRKIALAQHNGGGRGGGMLSFRIAGGFAAAERFCANIRLFTLAESLGGVQSLVEVPGPMTHALLTKEQREETGVMDDLVRLSCGVEDTEDLVEDVLQAVQKAVQGEV